MCWNKKMRDLWKKCENTLCAAIGSMEDKESMEDEETQTTEELSSRQQEADGGDVFKILHSLRLQDQQEREDGLLTSQVVAGSLSQLECCADSAGCVLVKASLQNKNLRDISVLQDYAHLRIVNLSHNQLTDLSPLQALPHLEGLDVSHNKLRSLLGFSPPQFLNCVDYSHNQVELIPDLMEFWSLVNLDLSHNHITHISGLQQLRYLRYLNLSYNHIKRFENLNYTRIKNLMMNHNQISEFEEGDNVGMKTMMHLKFVCFSHNQLKSLALFQGVYTPKVIELTKNNIRSPQELDFLGRMMSLEALDMRYNPITNESVYRHKVLHVLPSLTMLDGDPIPVEDKVLARDVCRPSELERAARLHTRLTTLHHLNLPDIGLETHPLDQGPLPLVVLVGPLASNKNRLVQMLESLLPHKVEIGVNHTTRLPLGDGSEENGKCYYFISNYEFDEMAAKGEFLTTNTVLGRRYGFTRRELAKAAAAHKLCVTHMDMIGALALFSSAVQPHFLLVMPRTEQLHLQLLQDKYEARKGAVVSRRGGHHVAEEQGGDEMENSSSTLSEDPHKAQEYFFHTVLKSRESYLSLHQNNPGFFLETIFTDCMDDAVERLVKFVVQVSMSPTNEKPIYSIDDDPVYHAMMSSRLTSFKKEILTPHSAVKIIN